VIQPQLQWDVINLNYFKMIFYTVAFSGLAPARLLYTVADYRYGRHRFTVPTGGLCESATPDPPSDFHASQPTFL
jgi:hypothetical protein